MNLNDRISRRQMLLALGVGGAGLTLAACGGTGASTARNAALNSEAFDIPNPVGHYPTGTVNLRWVDSGDQKAVFFNAFFPVYEQKHPNVHVTYDGTDWNTIQQELTLGLRNGTAPDVFQLPLTITTAEAVANNWIAPLDDFVPHWPQVKAAFPIGTFAAGVTDFGGKTYAYPFTSNQRLPNGLFYNTTYLERAGYDPNKILTWEEFRAAAKKATQQGQGRYYGVIIGIAQTGQITGWVDTLAEMAGAHGGAWPAENGVGGPFNWKTGTYNFTTDIYQEAVELLLAMKSDGSFFPGTVSLTAPQARGEFPEGVAAFILQGPWNIPAWKKTNPSLKFGFNLPPQKDPNNIWPLSYGPGGSNTWLASARSTALPVVGDIFRYLGTLKGQIEWADYDGAGDPPQFRQAVSHVHLDPISAKALELGYKWTVLRPDPELKTSGVAIVNEVMVPPTPNWNDTLVGLFTGQITAPVKTVLKGLQDRYTTALEQAIKTANARGANVSMDDWIFPDWNPRVAYPYPNKT